MAHRFSFFKRRAFWLALSLSVVLLAAVIAGANFWVLHSTGNAIFTDSARLPENEVALVLGTSRYNADGHSPNRGPKTFLSAAHFLLAFFLQGYYDSRR
jgi:vancomycin permeability regulator SanA